MAESIRVSDPATLRAVAHPVRQRILTELGILGHARAADLAEVIGRPANSISFHLRTLAEAGIIVEAPEFARDKRDRVWKRVADAFSVDPMLPGIDAAAKPYFDWLRRLLGHTDLRESTDATSTVNLRDGLLTKEEADQLIDEVNEIIERWHERSITAARTRREEPDRRYYQVLFAVGPQQLPEQQGDAPDEAVESGAGGTTAGRE